MSDSPIRLNTSSGSHRRLWLFTNYNMFKLKSSETTETFTPSSTPRQCDTPSQTRQRQLLSGHTRLMFQGPEAGWLTCSLVWQINTRGPRSDFDMSVTVSLATPLLFFSESMSNPRHLHCWVIACRNRALFSPIPPANTTASSRPWSLT